MKRVKLKNGTLEMLVRRELFARGLRYRCHVRELPGTPDIVFSKQKIAVFVDGDFWHGWRLPSWDHKLKQFWRDKLYGNRLRDVRNFRRLRAHGWCVIRLWQHEVLKNLPDSIARIENALIKNVIKPRALRN
jgi:DNA mismatch endonuclease (patch repair protein)